MFQIHHIYALLSNPIYIPYLVKRSKQKVLQSTAFQCIHLVFYNVNNFWNNVWLMGFRRKVKFCVTRWYVFDIFIAIWLKSVLEKISRFSMFTYWDSHLLWPWPNVGYGEQSEDVIYYINGRRLRSGFSGSSICEISAWIFLVHSVTVFIKISGKLYNLYCKT